jgi:5-hydroxyisourate hydrolase
MPAKLSTHVLDTAHGCPAQNMKIELWWLGENEKRCLKTAFTNADGRTDGPLLSAEEMKAGHYELLFFVGDYFAAKTSSKSKIPFLDQVPVRFGISDAAASYHVPLLCSPWAYSTYRGS